MTEDKQEQGRPFEALQEEQLRRYAAELATLYRTLRSRASSWLDDEKQFRVRGSHAETVHQMLSAAHMNASVAAAEDLSPSVRRVALERLVRILERGLRVVADYRRELGPHGRDDLGLAALLREEVYRRSADCGWDVQVEAEAVQPSPLVETSAYLIVLEALEQAASAPNITKLSMVMRTELHQLLITITFYKDSSEPEGKSVGDDPVVFLTRLYARLARGSCQWSNSLEPAAIRMELALPLDSVVHHRDASL